MYYKWIGINGGTEGVNISSQSFYWVAMHEEKWWTYHITSPSNGGNYQYYQWIL